MRELYSKRHSYHKIKKNHTNHSGANPRTYIDKARQTLKELEKSTKPSDTLMLGEMKCISKGLFGDKTERRKVSIKGNSLLCFHLIHDSERREPRETYVIRGSAIRLYDMWNYQFTLRAFKLESSYLSKKKKIGDSTLVWNVTRECTLEHETPNRYDRTHNRGISRIP